MTEISVDIYAEEVVTYLDDQKYQEMRKGKSFFALGKRSDVNKKEMKSAKCNVNKERKQNKTKSKRILDQFKNL